MVGEIRSIAVSSPVNFSDVSAIMSDSSTGENGKELSEMQRVTLLKEEFGAFDPYKLDRIWAIMYDNLRSILKNRGGNDYKPEHNGKRKRQKNAGTAVDLTVPMEDYHECVRLVREYRRAHPLE